MIATADVLHALTNADSGWGWLDLNVSEGQGLCAIEGFSHGTGFKSIRMNGRTCGLPSEHGLRNAPTVPNAAVWYRAKDDVPLSFMHRYLARRPNAVCPIDQFQGFVTQGWREPPAQGVFYALMEDRSNEQRSWTAWDLAGGEATPASLVTYDPALDSSAVFVGHWPQQETRRATAAVVGVGSVGSAAAMALSSYEVGNLVLIDHDRLMPHNVARHQCGPKDIGRFKVDAVRDLVQAAYPNTSAKALRLDVITDADLIRPVLDDVDVVVCCADGVAARQTTSHLCSQARRAAVFACVFENGAFGEIVRVPQRDDVGCLQCLRQSLEASGTLDPEPGIDLEYGTGTSHRPMTAIAGDLALVGSMAAKAAVSTVLERIGYRDQRWTGDHLVVGLRPDDPFPRPFDQRRVFDITASPMPPPDPECPLCCGDRAYS